MKKFIFLLVSLPLIIVFSSCSDKEAVTKAQVTIEPVGANYLVLKPSKFITKTGNNLPIVYLEHLREKKVALKTVLDSATLSIWYNNDGSIIDLTYYDKNHLPNYLTNAVLDTISGTNSLMYTNYYLHPVMINVYPLKNQRLAKGDTLTMIGEKYFFWTKVKYTSP